MRKAVSFIIILLVVIGVIVGLVVAVGALGHFLLPIALVIGFIVLMSAIGPSNVPPWVLVGGIPLTFIFGWGAQAFLGSIIGYDPIAIGYATGLSAFKLSTVGFELSDSTFSAILGFIVIIAVVILAMAGLFAQQMRRKR
jgi:hypothetical protein